MGRGSTWRRWDLHVHTPDSFAHQYSFLNAEDAEEYGNSIWEKYVDELEHVKDISVLGATDYFCIDGYERLLDYRRGGRLRNFDLVLPNVEFRLDTFIGGRRLNYHVILSDEVEADIIRKDFLEELHVRTPQGEARKLSRHNIEEIGRALKEHHEAYKGKSDYVIGCANVTVSLNEISAALKGKGSLFGGKYLLVLAEEGWADVNWDGQSHLTRKEILYRSHALFSANENTREWALGKTHKFPHNFVQEFGSLKPCIHGSDAHSFERMCRPDENRYCWIKAEPSFEGLRQILFEPEDRVRIGAEHPGPHRSVYTLDFVEFSDSRISDDLSIQEGCALLNPGMVAVIGGKGDGKTAFLDLLANCFEDRCARCGVDPNSFVQRIEEQKPKLTVRTGFLGSEVEPFGKGVLDAEFFAHSRITYLPQGRIEEHCADRNKLDRKIEEVVFSSKEVAAGDYRETFEALRSRTGELARGIEDVNRQIHQLELQTTDDIEGEIDRNRMLALGRVKDKRAELAKLTKTIHEDSRHRTEELKRAQRASRVEHSKVEGARKALKGLRHDLEAFLSDLNDRIRNLNDTARELTHGAAIPSINVDARLKSAQKLDQLLESKADQLLKQIGERETEIGRLSGAEFAHAQLLAQLEMAQEEAKSYGEGLKELGRKRSAIESLELQRLEQYIVLVSTYFEWRRHYQEVIATFSDGKSATLGAVDFLPTIHFDRQRFLELGFDIVDLRKAERSEIDKCAGSIEQVLSLEDEEGLVDHVKRYVTAALRNAGFLRTTRTSEDLYRWVFGDYFSVGTGILLGGIELQRLSMGQKGTVLLKLMLAEGEHPLIVDQPEESLDNRFIYDELVGAFRDAKSKRQVLIATSNANLVVNTDAEQVVVARFQDGEISYRSGALEDLSIREDVTAILEGGEEAFRRREEKYGLETGRRS
jgi:hypothetical protein